MFTTVNDILSTTMSMLEQLGANWTIFQLYFQMAVEEKGLWNYYNRNKVWPTTSSLSAVIVFSSILPALIISVISPVAITLFISSTTLTVLFENATEVLK